MRVRVFIFFLFILIFFPLNPGQTASAKNYLKGTVTVDGQAFTKSASVSVWCTDSSQYYSSTSGYATTDSSGNYSMTADSSWNPCYSNDTKKYSCSIQAYQWEDTSITNSGTKSLTLDCSATNIYDLALIKKNKTISATVTAGNKTLTGNDGIYTWCSQTTDPYTYSSTKDSDVNGVFSLAVTPGTYRCNAYCDWNIWKDSCPYTDFTEATATIGENDTSTTAKITASGKDSTIKVSVYAGKTLVTSGISVSCSKQVSPYTSSYVSKSSSDGTFECKVTPGEYRIYSYCSSWPCEYDGNPSVYATVGESETVNADLAYAVKDKTMHLKLVAGNSPITSGMSAYCSKQGGDYYSSYAYSATDGNYDIQLGEGKHYCSAYCSDYNNCVVSGYPSLYITFESADTEASGTLTFLRNDATISGIVTAGGSGLANVYVNMNSYDVATSGGVSASVSAGTAYASVTQNDAYTQVWRSVTADSSGAFVTTVPPGTYTITAYPPYGSKYGQASLQVTAKAKTTTTVNLKMLDKNGTVSGKLTDSDGNALKGWINTWTQYGSAQSSDWGSATTDADGSYSIPVIEGLTYNVSASIDKWSYENTANKSACNYTQEGTQTVVGTSGNVTVNFTGPRCDCPLTVNAVNDDEDIVSTNASVDAKPKLTSSGQNYYSIWGYMKNGTVILDVEKEREYDIRLWASDSTHVSDNTVTTSCSGEGSSVDIPLSPVDRTISGKFIDSDGKSVKLGKNSYLHVSATKGSGNTYRSCDVTTEGYTCQVSKGIWNIGYWISSDSDHASSPPGTSSTEIDVSSSTSVQHDLTLLKTGKANVTVLNYDGTPRSSVWIEANPFSIGEGANSYQLYYSSGGCQTDSQGTCTMKLGAASLDAGGTKYFFNAHMSYYMKSQAAMNDPEEVGAAIVAGSSTNVTLQYTKPDGLAVISVIEGDVTVNASASSYLQGGPNGFIVEPKHVLNAYESASSSPIAKATVDCFSDKGGSVETTTDDNGNATCACTSQDIWYAVAYKIQANNIFTTSVDEVYCDTEATPNTLTINYASTMPESVSIKIPDGETEGGTVELTDGFSVFFPAGSLGKGERTVSVTPTLTPVTANKRPVSWSYSVNATDENGSALTQLSSPAVFTVPVDQTKVEKNGLAMTDIDINYYDTTVCHYKKTDNSSVLTPVDDKHFIKFEQTHLTDFAIVGNGYLGAIEGGDGNTVGLGDDGSGSGTGNNASGGGGCSVAPNNVHTNGYFALAGFLLAIASLALRRLAQGGFEETSSSKR